MRLSWHHGLCSLKSRDNISPASPTAGLVPSLPCTDVDFQMLISISKAPSPFHRNVLT